MYNNQSLLQISSETIGFDSAIPDVEVCAQNYNLIIVKCAVMYYNWSMVDISNCWETFFRPGANYGINKWYVFNQITLFVCLAALHMTVVMLLEESTFIGILMLY